MILFRNKEVVGLMKVFLLVEYAVRTVFMLSVIFFVSGNHSGNFFDYLCNIYGGFFLSDAYSFFFARVK